MKAVAGPRMSSLAGNYLLLTAGEAAAKLLALASFTHLGRVLGPQGYGNLEFAWALLVFFTLSADLGLGTYGAREVGKDRSRAAAMVHSVCRLRLLLAFLSFGALSVFVLLTPKSTEVRLLIVLLGCSLFGTPLLLQWLFQGFERMRWVAAATITRQAVFAGLVFLFVNSLSSLVLVGLAECAAVAAAGLLVVWATRKIPGLESYRRRRTGERMGEHLRQAAPIGFSELAWAGLWYLPMAWLGWVLADGSVGWYGACHRVLTALHTFVWLYFYNLLPSISRCSLLPKQELIRLMDRSLALSTWCSAFVALVFTLMGRELHVIAYGVGFPDASRLLSWMVWLIPLAMVGGHYRYILLAYGHQRRLFRWTAAAAIVTALLCGLLIPAWGAFGAVLALLAGNLTNMVLPFYSVDQGVASIPCARHLVRPAIALAVSLAAFHVLAALSLGIWLCAGGAAVLYLAALASSQYREWSRWLARAERVAA